MQSHCKIKVKGIYFYPLTHNVVRKKRTSISFNFLFYYIKRVFIFLFCEASLFCFLFFVLCSFFWVPVKTIFRKLMKAYFLHSAIFTIGCHYATALQSFLQWSVTVLCKKCDLKTSLKGKSISIMNFPFIPELPAVQFIRLKAVRKTMLSKQLISKFIYAG